MARNVFYVDKITTSIEDVATEESWETEVLRMASREWGSVLKKNGWMFNWKKELGEVNHEVYKLVIKGEGVIQGLISIQRQYGYIEMPLIEVAPHNLGRRKKYYGVAGNLVAFACKKSFEMGFEGCLGFTAKTKLIQHYRETLGAELIYRNRMEIAGESARKLVNSYFKGYLK